MRCVLPLVAIFSLAFAPAPLPRRAKPDTSAEHTRALQGAWHRVRITVGGRLLDIGAETTVTIANGRMSYAVDGRPTVEWVFTLDGTKKPARFDREEIGRAANGRRRGVYRIEGDTFTLYSRNGERPGDLAETAAGVIVEVFKRTKP